SFGAWERQLAWYVHFAVAARMPDPVGRLRVVSLVDGAQRLVTVREPPGAAAALADRLDEWVVARESRLAWLARRRAAPVTFAHDAPRPGQDAIVAAVEAAVREGRHLLLEAPTGIGKTAAVLAGALRASEGRPVFWATARTTQQAVVELTARRMAALGTPIRAATLRAREKACLAERVDCRPEACRFADGHFERLRAHRVLDRLAEIALPSADEVGAVAKERVLCPYELALEWADGCDLVVGDFNYVFDPGFGRFGEGGVVIVDEAHQLPDRAAAWGSPELPRALVDAVAERAPPGWGALKALAREIGDAIEDAALLSVGEVEGALIVEANRRRWEDLCARIDEVALDHARVRLPDDEDPWLPLARAVLRFGDALARAGEETVALWTPVGLRLLCRDPSRLLAPAFARAHASVSMSATLAPAWFFRERCGLDADRTTTLAVEPPFPPENRRVVAVPGVSTAMKDRPRDRDTLRDLLARTVAAVPGNVAVYFGGFEQLADLLPELDRPVLVQTPAMDEDARARMVAALREPGPPRVLAAVLGGIFAEGIDLPGDALRAVIVVGPALPPPSPERALVQAWYEERFDQGFELAYVQPGMTRVVQAAGRVVRGPEDRGLVVLLCQRFLRTEYARHLPPWWEVTKSRRPWEAAAGFFGAEPG
ncbi:MAG: ATP-dependent DNA helicase, partial [Myxococcota bacterium]